jgi:hypothetical protein
MTMMTVEEASRPAAKRIPAASMRRVANLSRLRVRPVSVIPSGQRRRRQVSPSHQRKKRPVSHSRQRRSVSQLSRLIPPTKGMKMPTVCCSRNCEQRVFYTGKGHGYHFQVYIRVPNDIIVVLFLIFQNVII